MTAHYKPQDRKAVLKADALRHIAALTQLEAAIFAYKTDLIGRADDGRLYTDEDHSALAFYQALAKIIDGDRTIDSYIDDKMVELGMDVDEYTGKLIERANDNTAYNAWAMAEGR